MMKMNKRVLAAALAGVIFFGAGSAVAVQTSVAEAASQKTYTDGTSNEYSHRMHEEEVTHNQNVRAIRYEYRKDGDQKKYDQAMKREQKRHDKVVNDIKSDYAAHARHEKHHR